MSLASSITLTGNRSLSLGIEVVAASTCSSSIIMYHNSIAMQVPE
jgi:hypothetical protein